MSVPDRSTGRPPGLGPIRRLPSQTFASSRTRRDPPSPANAPCTPPPQGRDVLKCTKAKNKALLGTAYIGPAQREKVRNQRIRELKMSLREKPVETSPVPYTLSAMRKGLLAPLADYPTFITEPVVQPEATQESAAPLTPDPEASDTGVGEAQEAEQPTANSPSKRKAQVRVLV